VWNINEYLNGSDPIIVDTFFLSNPARVTNAFHFFVLGPTNARYKIQYSTNLLPNGWTTLRNITNITGTTLVIDTNAALQRRFYRATP
jgi:hypothetical protein